MSIEQDTRPFRPTWPALDRLPKRQIRFGYDRPTDTLFVDFYGRARPASSEPLGVGDRDYLFLRVDPVTQEVVGLQIEDFLAYAVGRHPEFVAALEIAHLDDLDATEAAELRHWAREQARGPVDAHALIATVEHLSV
jgi:hypothetical protein